MVFFTPAEIMSSSGSELSDVDSDNADDERNKAKPGKKSSKQQRDEDERRQFMEEDMLNGIVDDDEESAADVLRTLNDKATHANLLAKEMREYSCSFFKRKDVKVVFKKKDEYGNAIIKHQSYVKEFLVWNFWTTGADADDNDDECTDSLMVYLETLVRKGRDVSGKKLDTNTARQFRFLATAEHLEDFLREYFIKYRQR